MLPQKDIKTFENLLNILPDFQDVLYVYITDYRSVVINLLKYFNFPIKGLILDIKGGLPETFMGAKIYALDEFLQETSGNAFVISIGQKINLEPRNVIFSANINYGEKDSNIKKELPTIDINLDILQAVYDKRIAEIVTRQYTDVFASAISLENMVNHFLHGVSYMENTHPILYTILDEKKPERPCFSISDTAIVMQGPVHYDQDLTLHTLIWYRTLYPHTPIVVSTWKGVEEPFRLACERENIHILENDYPKDPGMEHINYQLLSSRKGIEFIKNNTSVRYVLKTRTDQRFYKMDFLNHFRNLLKAYPPKGKKLKKRLVFSSVSYALWPFFLCDFFVFGHIDDVKRIYDIPFMTSEGFYHERHRRRFGYLYYTLEKIAGKSGGDLASLFESPRIKRVTSRLFKFNFPETYTFKTFHSNAIKPLTPQNYLRDYWKFLRDYVVIADVRDLLFYWPKYYFWELKVRTQFDQILEPTMDHSRWLELYLNSDKWLS